MTDIAEPLDELRIALGEADTLALVTAAAYDSTDWSGSDPDIVERVACLLGLISKSTSAALSAFNRLHGAIADAQPASAPAGEEWDYSEGTASGEEPGMSAEDAAIVRRLRARLAVAFGQPADHPFFSEGYQPGEAPDVALLRMFKRNKRVLARSDEDVIAAMAHPR